MNKDTLEDLVFELSAAEVRSLANLRDILKVVQKEPVARPEEHNLNWCICFSCVQMPTVDERVCCTKNQSVTKFHAFKEVCLDRDILEVNIKAQADHYAEDVEFTTNSYRKAPYRQFTLWKYGKLGYENRRVIPSCVVVRVLGK